ncbi:deoxyribodipyrimidine photolyase [Salipaludibacillus neizhouensis]|uniref:Deoxyribodipyrimidine photolyase n=1 Tax=Salipaludibacillus neizhouensis TaxID=885475 RepID=A0A3A9JY67_9BACI|nr:deoxyribodipyrimidine photo-lyase [Salipaludibacillus neizhouensis]RKL65834.1 deoxyribodipyrimidine photolyase [Salipaludibacillus neizhouensis]
MAKTYAVWFRSDFRFEDNTALYHAIETAKHDDGKWIAFFHLDPIFTSSIDLHHDYFFRTLEDFRKRCVERGIHLHIIYGKLEEALHQLRQAFPDLKAVFYNRDEAGDAHSRDKQAESWMEDNGVELFSYEDAHIHGPQEVKKKDGTLYKVFTPYFRAWGRQEKPTSYKLDKDALRSYYQMTDSIDHEGENYFEKSILSRCLHDWQAIGEGAALERLESFADTRLNYYKENRDFPKTAGTSRLSPFLKTGVLSPRLVYRTAVTRLETGGAGAETFIQELAWRDFYYMIHAHFPESKNKELTEKYQSMEWETNEERLDMWKKGKTGFPIVDAGMRQLNELGWMHNRLRMVTASFLTKDYMLDWRLGERYFQGKLIDYDASSNIGGWQWAASVGTDAVPYFRVFNPTTQGKRFDPDGSFIRKYVAELAKVPDQFIHEPAKMTGDLKEETKSESYPEPTVDHGLQRKKVIAKFKMI